MDYSEISLKPLHLCNNMNLPNISRFGNALILAFEPKTRNFIWESNSQGQR